MAATALEREKAEEKDTVLPEGGGKGTSDESGSSLVGDLTC